jgi:hemerythrin superfamily protein
MMPTRVEGSRSPHTIERAREKDVKARKKAKSRTARSGDAIALLKADHREVEKLFKSFEKARTGNRKQQLAGRICNALRVHTTIEEEIFYPEFLESTDSTELHHEAEVEHEGAKNLIAKIEASDGQDEYLEARVTVLSEMIKHHVKEEEQPGGMFAKARASEMDLRALGERMRERKDQLQDSAGERKSRPPRERGLLERMLS